MSKIVWYEAKQNTARNPASSNVYHHTLCQSMRVFSITVENQRQRDLLACSAPKRRFGACITFCFFVFCFFSLWHQSSEVWLVLLFTELTRSPRQSVKFSRWKLHSHLLKEYIFPSCNKPLSILFLLMQVHSLVNAEKKTNVKRISNFTLLLVVFKWHPGIERVNTGKSCKCIERRTRSAGDNCKP